MHDDELERRIARLRRKIAFFHGVGNHVRATELEARLELHLAEHERRHPLPVEREEPKLETADAPPVKRGPGRPRKHTTA